ncbi:DoxX family protein [Brevundimonas sp.]|uniref:DoxX family protein n=1 Tax=Brevundimonas sp. TaxID=1871086 RepID=UPI002FC8846F
MTDQTVPLTLRSKLKSGLQKAACNQTHTANGQPAMAPRQLRVRAIWTNAMLWTFQGWLAMFYAGASFAKLTAPPKHLAILLGWAEHVPQQFVMAVGAIEAALAIGMLVPIIGWTIGKPVLTYSALGLLAIQSVVAGYHLASLDIMAVVLNLILMAMTASILIFKCARNVA